MRAATLFLALVSSFQSPSASLRTYEAGHRLPTSEGAAEGKMVFGRRTAGPAAVPDKAAAIALQKP